MRARIWLALAEVQRAAGDAAEADAAVATALELYEQKGNVAAAERLRASARERVTSALLVLRERDAEQEVRSELHSRHAAADGRVPRRSGRGR